MCQIAHHLNQSLVKQAKGHRWNWPSDKRSNWETNERANHTIEIPALRYLSFEMGRVIPTSNSNAMSRTNRETIVAFVALVVHAESRFVKPWTTVRRPWHPVPRNFPRRNDESLEATTLARAPDSERSWPVASFQSRSGSRRWKPGKPPWQMTESVRLMSRHCAAHHADVPVPVHGDWSQIASETSRFLANWKIGESRQVLRTFGPWIGRVRRRRRSMGNLMLETEEYWNVEKKILI